jgi:hypothetical protein
MSVCTPGSLLAVGVKIAMQAQNLVVMKRYRRPLPAGTYHYCDHPITNRNVGDGAIYSIACVPTPGHYYAVVVVALVRSRSS